MMDRAAITLAVASLLMVSQSLAQPVSISRSRVEPANTVVKDTTWRGSEALKVMGLDRNRQSLVLLPGTNIHNGEITAEVAGLPEAGAPEGARGFIGIAFRLQRGDTLKYECFYLRPTNGRASDQLRRNHSTQYVSHPYYPWYRLRQENPGVYESYVDLVPGDWTPIRIVVKDTVAQLFVNDASQPCLIVNDLKRGDVQGEVALWIGVGTEAYYRNLKILQE